MFKAYLTRVIQIDAVGDSSTNRKPNGEGNSAGGEGDARKPFR